MGWARREGGGVGGAAARAWGRRRGHHDNAAVTINGSASAGLRGSGRAGGEPEGPDRPGAGERVELLVERRAAAEVGEGAGEGVASLEGQVHVAGAGADDHAGAGDRSTRRDRRAQRPGPEQPAGGGVVGAKQAVQGAVVDDSAGHGGGAVGGALGRLPGWRAVDACEAAHRRECCSGVGLGWGSAGGRVVGERRVDGGAAEDAGAGTADGRVADEAADGLALLDVAVALVYGLPAQAAGVPVDPAAAAPPLPLPDPPPAP